MILLMEVILPQLISSLSHYLQGFSTMSGGFLAGFLNHQQYVLVRGFGCPLCFFRGWDDESMRGFLPFSHLFDVRIGNRLECDFHAFWVNLTFDRRGKTSCVVPFFFGNMKKLRFFFPVVAKRLEKTRFLNIPFKSGSVGRVTCSWCVDFPSRNRLQNKNNEDGNIDVSADFLCLHCYPSCWGQHLGLFFSGVPKNVNLLCLEFSEDIFKDYPEEADMARQAENASLFQIAGRCMLCMFVLDTRERCIVFVVFDKVLFIMASE